MRSKAMYGNQYLIGLVFLLPLFLLSTCKKDKECPENCEEEQGFQMVKDWMYFKTGSYWIYEEENSGAIDTLSVYDDAAGLSGGGFDAFHCFTISTYDEYEYKYTYNSSFTIHCLNTPNCQCEKVSRYKVRPGDFVGGDKLFIIPPIENNYTGSGLSGVTTITEIIEEYSVVQNEIHSVAIYHTENNASEGYQETNFYVAKHIGIVRKELLGDDEVWNLIEYEVMQ